LPALKGAQKVVDDFDEIF